MERDIFTITQVNTLVLPQKREILDMEVFSKQGQNTRIFDVYLAEKGGMIRSYKAQLGKQA